MSDAVQIESIAVNCRIGSLEIVCDNIGGFVRVNCRIGSLENIALMRVDDRFVNCRIGSLEMLRQILF